VRDIETDLATAEPARHAADHTSKWKVLLVLAVLVVAAYAPACNNGFISDDYVMLGRLEELKRNPLYLFSIPPETFRATCYGFFALLRGLFGYRAPLFYAFAVALHLANAVLLWRFLGRLPAARHCAALAAAFFAVYQNPQEGVMWLAGTNESLMTTCVLGALIAWACGRLTWFAVLFAVALFSKESALVLILLVPLADAYRSGRLRFRREYLAMAIPVLPFLAVYVSTRHANALLTNRLYEVHVRAVWVLLNSFHRMLFPWGYLALLLCTITAGVRPSLRRSMVSLAWTLVCLAPYILLTYQTHVPSRNQYLAATGVAWLLALATDKGVPRLWKKAFVAAFVSINIGYLWMIKDRQYVARAAPTAQLVSALRAMNPEPVLILNFPENPWIGANTALTVPNWSPSLLHVNQPENSCPACPRLTWDPGSQTYR
jgi:hypothetical protein